LILGIIASGITKSKLVTGSYESIATVSVGAGGTSYAEFTSIPSTYSHLEIRGMMKNSADEGILMRFNSDTASNYSAHYLYGTGSSAGSGNGAPLSYTYAASGPTSQQPSAFVISILDYADTNKYKTTRVLSGTDINGTGGYIWLFSGNWRSTSAISTIRIYPNAGTLQQYSHFALYGIKA